MTTESPKLVSIIVVDDHDVVRVGLASALRPTNRPGIKLVAEARTTAELERALSLHVCDVVVLDSPSVTARTRPGRYGTWSTAATGS